jgi:Flp pilus assembly protein TadG
VLRRLRIRPDGGQSIVFITIAMPVILAVSALAIDGSHLFVEKRHTQNAADAAALAAAAELPTDGSSCTGTYNDAAPPLSCAYRVSQAAKTYSAYNGGPDIAFPPCGGSVTSDCYVTPYKGSSAEVQVRITVAPNTFFLGAAGIAGPIDVSSSAAAVATPQTSTVTIPGSTSLSTSTSTSTSVSTTTVTTNKSDNALFAADTACSSGITFESNNETVTGFMHSNGGIAAPGNNNTFAAGSYGNSTTSCTPSANTSADFTSLTHDPVVEPFPLTWDENVLCGPAPRPSTITISSSVMPGVYCASSSIIVTGNNWSGTMTLVAPSITISGNSVTLTGWYSDGTHQLVAYQTGAGTLGITGNTNNFTGFFYAPLGTISIDKNNAAQGFFEALDIDIAKNNFSIVGQGPGGTPTTITSTSTSTSTSTTVTTITTPSSTTVTTTGTTIGLDE